MGDDRLCVEGSELCQYGPARSPAEVAALVAAAGEAAAQKLRADGAPLVVDTPAALKVMNGSCHWKPVQTLANYAAHLLGVTVPTLITYVLLPWVVRCCNSFQHCFAEGREAGRRGSGGRGCHGSGAACRRSHVPAGGRRCAVPLAPV